MSRDNLLTEAEGDAKEYEPAAIDEDIKLEDLLNELENGAWDLVNPVSDHITMLTREQCAYLLLALVTRPLASRTHPLRAH